MKQSLTMLYISKQIADRYLSDADYKHSYHVMTQVTGIRQKILAMLHDVIEGQSHRMDDILQILSVFGKGVVADLLLLTHDDNDRYRKYIQKLSDSGSVDAITVKLADLTHNMDMTRLDKVDQYHIDRNKKYQKAHRILTGSLNRIQSLQGIS